MTPSSGRPASRPDAEDGDALRVWLRTEAKQPFAGLDFSYIDVRTSTEPLPWDYGALVTAALPDCRALLDMGTGGGERLAALAPLPAHAVATEGYAPNLPVARTRLEPLGVTVVEVGDDDRLPFDDASFDLVINRHEFYDPGEVRRVLTPGGHFITQQVGSDNDLDLNRLLDAPLTSLDTEDWRLETARAQLEASGFRILRAAEARPTLRFFDVGALVFHLTAIPWQIPDFDVERYFPQLQALHRRCLAGEPITTRNHRFLLMSELEAEHASEQ